MAPSTAVELAPERKAEFSPWIPWHDRAAFEHRKLPGVYVIAYFESVPGGPADPLSEQVVYIGETCDRTLHVRWRQFHNSAFLKKRGHSGGMTHAKLRKIPPGGLFVAALPFAASANRSLHVRYVERKLIWEFAQKWGSGPCCNRK
jgi:hypothetical protein